jgi:hypothetical protein
MLFGKLEPYCATLFLFVLATPRSDGACLDPQKHMFVCENYQPDFMFNSGFMVFKNSNWSFEYLKQAWNSPPP